MGADPRKAPAREKDDKRNGKQIAEQRREKGLAERKPHCYAGGQPAAQLDDRQHRNEHGRKEFSLAGREQPLHDRVCHAPLPFLNDNAPII